MADALGHLSKMGIVDVATWTTAHPGTQLDTMHFVSESLTEEYERIERAGLVGSGGKEPSDQGNKIIRGSTVHELDYLNFLPWFFYLFGDATSPYDLSDDTVPEYYWIEFDKQVERWQFGASKLDKITIRGPEEGKVMMECEHVCRRMQRTATAFNGDSMGSMARCLYRQAKIRIADQNNAMADADTVVCESFELSMSRAMKGDDYGSKTSLLESVYLIEPVPGDFREVTLSVVLPRYASNLFNAWKTADTPLMADITLTGAANSLLFQLPEIRITEGFHTNIEGPAPIRQEGTFRAYKSSNANMYVGNEIRVTAA